MKLRHKLYLLTLLLPALLIAAVLLVGSLVINDIVYRQNRHLLQHELNFMLDTLAAEWQVLQEAGVDQLPAYMTEAHQQAVVQRLQQHRFEGAVQLFIVGADGQRLGAAPADDWPALPLPATVRQTPHGEFMTVSNGRPWFCVYATYPPWNWLVGLAVPADVLTSERNNYLLSVGLLAAAMLFGSLVIAYQLSRQLIRRLDQSLTCVRAVADGDFSARIPVSGSADELGELQRNINVMVATIQARTQQQQATANALRNSQAEIHDRLLRVQRQQAALAVIANHPTSVQGDFEAALPVITATVADALDLARVGIWLLSDDRTVLRCVAMFERTPSQSAIGATLRTDDYPAYFRAFLSGRAIDAHDARRDPRTQEFAVGYLQPLGITAMLDAAIRVAGRIVGVVCHEHIGGARTWQSDEVGFAGEVADQVAQLLANSERRRALEELERLRSLLRDIIDSMPSLLVGVDAEGRVTQWNREAERLTGQQAAAVQGKPVSAVLPQLAPHLNQIAEAIREQRPYTATKVAQDWAGQSRYADVTIYPLVGEGMQGAVIRLDDVTERVRIEEMMVQSEKMLSVGGLAAGMAHEINNPLAGILQNAQVVRQRLQVDFPKNRTVAAACGVNLEDLAAYLAQRGIGPMLEAIIASGQRAARIVENMLSFSRKSESKFTPQDLRELLDRTVELAASDYDLKKKYDFRQITIVREYAADVPQVCCEAGKVQQVFLNILRNGAEAMTANRPLGRTPRFVLRVQPEDEWVRVDIEDNGPGMTEAVRKRVFEPFFTTKSLGEGTGLGLSVSYFIITENHGGTLAVSSVPEQGANFIIRLPLRVRTG